MANRPDDLVDRRRPPLIGSLAGVGTTSNCYGYYGWVNAIAWRIR
jgi:hypothetical protein